jgi:methionine aminopeptidase
MASVIHCIPNGASAFKRLDPDAPTMPPTLPTVADSQARMVAAVDSALVTGVANGIRVGRKLRRVGDSLLERARVKANE